MNKPTILYITELFPYPPTSGAKIKSINTIQTLSKKFNIVLVCFAEKPIDQQNLQALTQFVSLCKVFTLKNLNRPPQDNIWQLLKNYLHLKPYFLFQFYSDRAEKYVQKLIKKIKPTVIHIDHLNMAQYLPKEKNEVWVFEEHNLENQLAWERFVAFKQLKKTKLFLWLEFLLIYFFEKTTLGKFDQIFAIANDDAKQIKKLHPDGQIFTQTLAYPTQRLKCLPKHNHHLLFIGDLTWHPNENAIAWFVNKIWPMIIAKEPTAQLDLVGKIENDFAQQLTTQPGIKVWGFQLNLKTFLAKADVFILPFKVGGGVRIKALTALAHRLPIVATTIGVRGLEGKTGRDYLVTDQEEKFAKDCLHLLRKPATAKRLAENGFKFLQTNHSNKNNQLFLKKYLSLI